MTRRTSFLCFVLAVMFASPVVACSSEKAHSTLPRITQGAKFGQKPTIAAMSGAAGKGFTARTLIEGHGDLLTHDKFVKVDFIEQIWQARSPLNNTYDSRQPSVFRLSNKNVPAGWIKALEGKRVGSRVEALLPPDLAYGVNGAPGVVPPGSSTVVVFDIIDAVRVPNAPKGVAVADSASGVPRVGTNVDGKAPSVGKPEGAPPGKLISNYVIEGGGEPVKKDDTAIIAYKTLIWRSGKVITELYGSENLQIVPLVSNLQGIRDGISGKKVGSRVLIVMPPNLAYGDHAYPSIPANSTLVMIVDILAKI